MRTSSMRPWNHSAQTLLPPMRRAPLEVVMLPVAVWLAISLPSR